MAPALSVSDLRRAKYRRRLPTELSALAGPDGGIVELPLHVSWSGLSRYDLDQPRLRMSCYRIVLAEGQHDDLVRYLNRDLLLDAWPVLRTLISRDIRDVWEDAFTELSHRVPATA
ncbi:transcriptional regulator [Streptomyces sp. JJ38]|uniref:transcriptional regulator n=1 Tax=Streptomyces sp. JJ38 TaxID=2738128 RepID=UPI001C5762CA|nr:transcriptional regulator [Streptomyces sp. JJ38]MBW1597498.1 transcriptional regulator [Streptomyces sp. JJ38]